MGPFINVWPCKHNPQKISISIYSLHFLWICNFTFVTLDSSSQRFSRRFNGSLSALDYLNLKRSL
jgi:hypothetical protein